MATVTRTGSYLDRMAGFVDDFDLGTAPADVVAHARLILLDTVGAIVAGCASPEVGSLQQRLGLDTAAAAGTASSPGSPKAFVPSVAAFVNGTAGTWDELDEGNYVTHQHPAVHVVPAALAVAEAHDLTGRALLEAVVVGYEVAARAGAATTFRDEVMHPHGTHGILGGAAAVAKLLGLPGPRILEAVRVASSMSVATARGTVFQGATVRNTYAGQAAQNAVLAGDLVVSGFTGQLDGPAAVFGTVSGTAFDGDRFVDGLGTDFLLGRNYFKLHACCAYNHATLDALRAATGGRRIPADDVARVEVTTYFPATRMAATSVANPLAAKFSLPYAVSAMLVHGSCDRAAFGPHVLSSPAVADLMTRVQLRESAEATRDYPDRQRAAVRVVLGNGEELAASVDRVRGDWRSPVPEATLLEKFDGLTSHLPGSASTRLREALCRVEDVSARTLGHLFRGERS